MTEINLYINALEILIETSINHQEIEEGLPPFEKICDHCNKLFPENNFNETLQEKVKFYKNLLANENEKEPLFINEVNIPYVIKEQIITSDDDKISIYVIILEWIKLFELPHTVKYKKLALLLEINQNVAKQVEQFIFNRNLISEAENYLCIKPNQNSELNILEGNWVESNKPDDLLSEEILVSGKINNILYALYLHEIKSFILTCDEEKIELRKKNKALQASICLLQFGDSISLENNSEISFAELKNKFVEKRFGRRFSLEAADVSLRFKNNWGLKSFNFHAYPGQLIGIVGKEGAGKTSLLNILSGVQEPTHGGVYLNSYNIFQNKYQLAGLIGYVPEDDLLFSELTAFENIDFAARLHLGNHNTKDRNALVYKILKDLDLDNIANKTLGEIEEKKIQPRQRRLLNIALELVRDPEILIIDNAKSGLSLSDASHVVDLLSKFTFNGKLIITSITETSNKSFESFDKIFILSENGTPCYFGSREGSLPHLLKFVPKGIKKDYEKLSVFTSVELIEIVDIKQSDSSLELKLHENYLKKNVDELKNAKIKNKLPGIKNPPPRLENQYFAYIIRNFKIKLARKKEMAYTIIVAPFIATLLALILRTSDSSNYLFSTNENIPTYFFLSIVVSIFFGLSQAAREIVAEKKILEREEHLNISMFSYINSKITFLFLIIFIQSLLYSVVGNAILGMKGLLIYHWTIYFSCGASGILLGLVFSSIHRTYESILIKTIPTTMIIVILLGGGWVPFDKITKYDAKYTPFISDLVISRWAYEAIMVQQFSENYYERNFFQADKAISIGAYNSYQLLPLLHDYIEYVSENYMNKPDTVSVMLNVIRKQFISIRNSEDIFPFEYENELNIHDFNTSISSESKDYLSYLEYFFSKKYNSGIEHKKKIADSLTKRYGENYLNTLFSLHNNHTVMQKVRNTNTRFAFKYNNGELTQLSDNVFHLSLNNIGRAHFFASEKRFNNQVIKTFEFNLSVIWLLNLLVYVLLILNIPNKLSAEIQKRK
jgi:ABC transport system ATP-binding/permease protein